MNHKRVVLIGLIYVALSVTGHPVTAAADGTSALATDKDDTIPVPPLDEVIVTGRKEKLSQLRVEVNQAEDAFYQAFNEINTEARYHTICDTEIATEMREKVHVCKPQFVTDAFQVGMITGELDVAASIMDSRMPLYKAHVHKLVHENPQLAKALGRYYALKQHYDAVHKERFKGKWFAAN